jgi:hypothetical protein
MYKLIFGKTIATSLASLVKLLVVDKVEDTEITEGVFIYRKKVGCFFILKKGGLVQTLSKIIIKNIF